MNIFNRQKIRRQYKKLVGGIEGLKIYDGRGKGIDVYICSVCHKKTLTRYKDKGVTPFIMQCPYCDGYAQHVSTISEQEARVLNIVEGAEIINWVRPPLQWLLKHKEAVEHVLDGGLVLETEILDEIPHIYD